MIFFFTRYGRLGASSRMRTFQYFDRENLLNPKKVFFNTLINDHQLLNKYKYKRYQTIPIIRCYFKRLLLVLKIKNKDIIYIEKELYPYLPYYFESLLLKNKKYILNYDDAVFDYYESNKNLLIRYFLSNKHKSLMKNASLTICGNIYLANYAILAGCKNVKILPTVIDLKRYKKVKNHSDIETPIICWIGSPSTIHNLKMIDSVFQALAKENSFILKIIGVKNYNIKGVNVDTKMWSEKMEINELRIADIGIMPLVENKFALGKCGYKLIQFMGIGLPVVASKVGENINIVKEGINGYLAENKDDWFNYLSLLLCDHKLRAELSRKGRELVKSNYSVQNTKKTFISFF